MDEVKKSLFDKTFPSIQKPPSTLKSFTVEKPTNLIVGQFEWNDVLVNISNVPSKIYIEEIHLGITFFDGTTLRRVYKNYQGTLIFEFTGSSSSPSVKAFDVTNQNVTQKIFYLDDGQSIVKPNIEVLAALNLQITGYFVVSAPMANASTANMVATIYWR